MENLGRLHEGGQAAFRAEPPSPSAGIPSSSAAGPLARPYPLTMAASGSAERRPDGRAPSRVVTTKAAVCARTAMTDETGFAIGRQPKSAVAIWPPTAGTLASGFVDDRVSGATGSRLALNQIMDEVHVGTVHAVAYSRLDRLGRSALHVNAVLGGLDAHGVIFVSVADKIESGSRAWLLHQQGLSRFNEPESDEISEVGNQYRGSPDSQAEGIPRR